MNITLWACGHTARGYILLVCAHRYKPFSISARCIFCFGLPEADYATQQHFITVASKRYDGLVNNRWKTGKGVFPSQ